MSDQALMRISIALSIATFVAAMVAGLSALGVI